MFINSARHKAEGVPKPLVPKFPNKSSAAGSLVPDIQGTGR